MVGNEIIKCFECSNEIVEEDCYECDCCQEKVHEQCITLSSSEKRVIPLQKRMMLFVCEKCRKLMTKMSYVVRMLETITEEFTRFRATLEQSRKSEMETLQQTIDGVMSKNMELTDRILALETTKAMLVGWISLLMRILQVDRGANR